MRPVAATRAKRGEWDWRYPGDLRLTQWGAHLLLGALGVLIVARDPHLAWGNFLLTFGASLLAQNLFMLAMRRRIGPERSTIADALTLCRADAAAILAGLVAAGLHDRASSAGIFGLLALIFGASACDWLDGPLARRLGPTQLGGVLDIEADSWLTLWSAAAACAWGGLPWFVVIPPLLHYLHPIQALRAGSLPHGGGPAWSRVTGVAQMLLITVALLPISGASRDLALTSAGYPIACAQAATMLITLRHAMRG
jgi:phosphatidylglycerophosphate synthase